MEYIERIGYHGTSRDHSTWILQEQDFVDSDRDNEWLGKGVYFFAYLAHAQWWTTHSRYAYTPTAVLKAKLKFTEKQLLDLDDPDTLNKVNRFVEEAVRKANEVKLDSVDFQYQHVSKKWNFSCNLVRRFFPQIGIISYTFIPRTRVGYSGYQETQKQYCVSDHTIIGQIEIV